MYMKRYTLKSKYGLTLAQYNDMLELHQYACGICRRKPKGWLVVDHCHSTNRVRGLLCVPCNVLLGKLESPKWQKAVDDYLARRLCEAWN